MSSKKITLLVILLVALGMTLSSAMFVNAGERVLSNNSGDGNTSWIITGEQTLVMNGFDLTQLGLRFPATIDKATLSVEIAVPGQLVDVVVYQDANGGSPVDATLAGQTQVNITQSGVFTVTFPTPISISQPVVWVGFYLPVGFKFFSDNSGSSVLTYWAWTPGGRFDLARLSSATVLGPSNGTAPVNLNLNGIARITAEISNAGAGVATTIPAALVTGTPAAATAGVGQIAATGSERMSVMRQYPPACDTLFWDTEDVGITFAGTIEPRCTAIWNGYAPAGPAGYRPVQLYYDITFYNDKGVPLTDKLPFPVTHCVQANPADINVALVALASGSPRSFKLLPTLRVGNLVCAEIDQSGGISYVIPG